MTLSPEQAATLRSKLLKEIFESTDPVDVAEKFIRPIFGSETPPHKSHVPVLNEWCKSWDVKYSIYSVAYRPPGGTILATDTVFLSFSRA